MGKKSIINVGCAIVVWLASTTLWGQSTDTTWNLSKCINYAMEKNINIQERILSNETNLINADRARAERFPSVNASVSQNFNWARKMETANEYGSYSGSNGTSYSINSSVKLYNGFRTQNNIKQAELNYKAGTYDIETIKESIGLNVLNAYLQVLYSKEQVKNAENQVKSTEEQLRLSDERLKLGSVSKADYLQVKSQLASEKLTLANAQSQLAINRVSLMQLMEIPVNETFAIEEPTIVIPENLVQSINADSVYSIALSVKPQIKSSEINKQIADLNVSIAKAGYQPTLSLNGGVSTNYQSAMTSAYDYQLRNKINPSLGLTLSIPIYQNKQVRSSVAIAKINTANAELNDVNTKNQLRKSVEQACVDVNSAIIKYKASSEKYSSTEESYNVAEEKFNQGMLNSVDFLIQKTNLIASESELLQSKFNLIFSQKILDFYTGKQLSL